VRDNYLFPKISEVLDTLGGCQWFTSADALPKKWINPWIGPFRMIKWVSERKCLLDCAGKEKEFTVNRLAKHNRWDEVTPSTHAWALREKVKEREKAQQV
jgi:hypothetical protein